MAGPRCGLCAPASCAGETVRAAGGRAQSAGPEGRRLGEGAGGAGEGGDAAQEGRLRGTGDSGTVWCPAG